MVNDFIINLQAKISVDSINKAISSIDVSKIKPITLQIALDTNSLQLQLQKAANAIGGIKTNSDSTNNIGNTNSKVNSGKYTLNTTSTRTDAAGNVKTTVNLMDEYDNKLKQVYDDEGNLISQTEILSEGYSKYQSALKSTSEKLEGLTKDHRLGSTASQEYANKLEEIKRTTNSTNYKEKAAELRILKHEMTSATQKTMSFGEMFGIAAKKFIIWMSATTLFYMFVRGIKNMISQVVQLDKALVELNKVADLTKEQLKNVTEQATELGHKTSRTITEVLEAVATFKKAGYSLEDSFNLGEVALRMTNVADGINDIASASSALISILKGLGETAEYASTALDMINYVSNNFAIDAADLTEVLTRMTSSLAQVGNSYEEIIGMATAMYEVNRNAEKTASALNMISVRLRRTTEDGEDNSELLSKIDVGLQKWTKGVVKVLDEAGNLRSTYDILEDLSTVYDKLSSKAQGYVNELIAGARQVPALTALLKNFSIAQDIVSESVNASGSALEEEAKYLDSIGGRLESLKASWQAFSNTLINSDLIKFVITLGDNLLRVFDSLGAFSFITLPAIAVAIGVVIRAVRIKLHLLEAQMYKVQIAAGWIGAAIAVLSIAIGSVISHNQKLNEEIAKQSEELETEIKDIQSLKKELLELNTIQEKSEVQKAKITSIIDILVEKYGLEKDAVDALNGSYDTLLTNLNELEAKETKEWLNLNEKDYNKAVKNINKLGATSYSVRERWNNEGKKIYDVRLDYNGTLEDSISNMEQTLSQYDDVLTPSQKLQLQTQINKNKEQLAGYEETITNYESKKNRYDYLTSNNSDINSFTQSMSKFNTSTLEEQKSSLSELYSQYENLLALYPQWSEEIKDLASEFLTQKQAIEETDYLLSALDEKLSIMKAYQEQLNEELDTQEKLLEVEKAREELAKAKQKRMLAVVNGRFVQVEDSSAIQEAQESLDSAMENAYGSDVSQALNGISALEEILAYASGDSKNNLIAYFRNSGNVEKFMNASWSEKIALINSIAGEDLYSQYTAGLASSKLNMENSISNFIQGSYGTLNSGTFSNSGETTNIVVNGVSVNANDVNEFIESIKDFGNYQKSTSRKNEGSV